MPYGELRKYIDSAGRGRKVARIIYKSIRAFYCSYIFYFLPYTTLWMPYLAAMLNMKTGDPD